MLGTAVSKASTATAAFLVFAVAPLLGHGNAGLSPSGASSLGSAFSRVESSVAALGKVVDGFKAEFLQLQERSEKGQPEAVDGQKHGRTIFMTMCAGAVYFDIYCGPLLTSFERAYGADASRHLVVAFTTNVKAEVLEAARARFAPWFAFEPVDLGKQHDFLHDDDTTETYAIDCERKDGQGRCNLASSDDGVDERNLRTGLNVILKFRQAAKYLGRHGSGFQYAVVMDSDALFVKTLARFLPAGAQGSASSAEGDWDVAFTTYDRGFVTPWADDAADVGRTRNGFVRINCGVFLLSLHDILQARRFLNRWAHVSELLFTAGKHRPDEEGSTWKEWQDQLVDEFRGVDPGGLALLLSSYDTDALPSLLGWETCQVCSGVVEARIGMYGGEGAMPIRARAFPARALNHAESMTNGTFRDDLTVVHLKGTWWRVLLSNGVLVADATRTPAWNRDAIALHRLAYYEWQFALPPQLRAQPRI